MSTDLIKFAQRIVKSPKDAEIDLDVLVEFVQRLPGWRIEGPVPHWARDKAGNRVRTDEWVRGDTGLYGGKKVIQAAVQALQANYSGREVDRGVDVADELPDTESLPLGFWILLKPTVKRGNSGDFTVLWQPHKLVHAYVLTSPDGAEFVLHSTLDRRPEWKSPGFWKWSAQHLKPAAEEFLANQDKFTIERASKPAHTSDDTGTCSVCFHEQVLDRRVSPEGITLDAAWGTGVAYPKAPPRMVLHGYRRPGGGETVGRCPGIVFQPYELSSEGTKWALSVWEARYEYAKAEYESWQAGAYRRKPLPAHRMKWDARDPWPDWSYGTYRKPIALGEYERKRNERILFENATVTSDDRAWPALHQQLGGRLLSGVREHEGQVLLLRKYVKEWKLRQLPGEAPKQVSTFSLPTGYVPARVSSGLVHAATKAHPWSKRAYNGWVAACVGSMMALDRTYVTEQQAGTEVTCKRCIKSLKGRT